MIGKIKLLEKSLLRILIVVVSLSHWANASGDTQNGNGSWWMVAGKKGTCVESVGQLDWLNPETVVDDYSCTILSDENSIIILECASGPLAGSNYVFSKNKAVCELSANILKTQ